MSLEGRSTALQNGRVQRPRRHAVAGGSVRAGHRLVGEPEPAVDERRALDGPALTGESIFEDHAAGVHPAQERSALDLDLTL